MEYATNVISCTGKAKVLLDQQEKKTCSSVEVEWHQHFFLAPCKINAMNAKVVFRKKWVC